MSQGPSKAEIAEIAAEIDRRLSQLDDHDRLGAEGRRTVALDQQSVGRLSRMDALQNQAMAHAQGARRAGERKRLLAARQRIAMDDYGHCMDCGEDIALPRLRSDPAVLRCIACARG